MDPIQVVGWEGVFGFLVTVIGMVIMYLAVGSTDAGRYGYFDIKEGWHEMINNRAIATSSILIMISIGYVSVSRRFRFFTSNLSLVASTSSVCPLLVPSLLHLAARSILAVRCSFGSSHSVWAGNHSNGFRCWVSHFLSMEHSCSMILSDPRSRLAWLPSTERERCCSPKTPLSIFDP